MSFSHGDMVRLNEMTSAYLTKSHDSALVNGIVSKSRTREIHTEKGRHGRHTELTVIDQVEVMWSDGIVQKVDGRYLEKLTARTIAQESDN